MRIRGWHIDGFGHFQDQGLEDLPDGITVFLGPNEAGKSTLLAFLRGMLFGFPSARQNRYEPLQPRHFGGRLFLEGEQGRYAIHRNGDRKDGFTLYRPDDSRGSAAELAQLLGHADPALFNSVFAFSLTELQRPDIHKEEGIKDRIFAGSLQGGRNTARDALKQLEKENAPVFKPRGREVALAKLSRELDAMAATIAQARGRSLEYDTLKAQEETLKAAIQDMGQAHVQLQRSIQANRTLLELWPRWLERQALAEELATLAEVSTFPEQAEARHAEALSRLKGLEGHLAELTLEEREWEDRLRHLQPDASLAALQERILAIAADASRFLDGLQALAENAEQTRNAHAKLDSHLAALGPSWTRVRLQAFDGSIPQHQEVARWEARLEAGEREAFEAARELKRACEEAAKAQQARSACEEVLARLGEGMALDAVMAEEERLVRLRANYARQRELSADCRQAEEQVRLLSIERARAPHGERMPLPVAARRGLWAVAALLIGLGLYEGFARDWLTAGLLVAMALALLGLSRLTIQPSRDEREALKLIAEQLAEAEGDHARRAQLLEGVSAALNQDAQAARLSVPVEAAALEVHARKLALAREQALERQACRMELDRLLAQERTAQARQDATETAHAAALQAHLEVAQEWKTWRQAAGLVEDHTPREAAQLFQALATARELLASLQALESSGETLGQRVAAWSTQALDLVAAAEGRDPGALPADAALAHAVLRLQERLEADIEIRRQREAATRAQHALRLKLEAKRQEVQAARETLEALHAAAGAEDAASFHQRRTVYEKRMKLQEALRDVERMLDEHLGRDAHAAELRARLAAQEVESWKHAIAEAEAQQAALMRERDASNQALGTLQEARQALEEASDVIARAHAQAALQDEFARQARGWLVRALAADMIQEALTEAEKKHQPGVLAYASQQFRTVTEGRYQRLVQQDGGEFQLVDANEARKGVEKLSQGTAEQLYLCLRLGLIRQFASQSANLPLIMDDVFVNFDPERARRLAEVLVTFAEAHQVLLFTCHPQTADLLREADSRVRLVTLPRYAHASSREVVNDAAVLD